MHVRDRLNAVLDAIADNPRIASRHINFDERPPDAGYLSGEINFLDGSRLFFKEFVIVRQERIVIVKYGYHYQHKDGVLAFRYDNSLDPAAKGLKTYPEHKHSSGNIYPAQRPDFNDVLREISEIIDRKQSA